MSISILLRCEALEQTRCFYQDVLGFQVESLNQDSLSARLGDCELMFTTLDLWQAASQSPGAPDSAKSNAESCAMSGTIYLGIADVDTYFRKVEDQVEILWPLQDMPYGTREFALRDCNGYMLAFVQKD